jgi:ABC-2 type transport system permease protein
MTLLYATLLSTAYIAAAAGLFTRIHRHAVRTGLIARYSAESLS